MKNNRFVFRYFFLVFQFLVIITINKSLFLSILVFDYFAETVYMSHYLFSFFFKFNIYWHQSCLFLQSYPRNGQRISILNIDFIWDEALTTGMAFAWHFVLVYKWAELNHGGQTGIWFNLERKTYSLGQNIVKT